MTTVLIAAPLVIASPIAVFILWDSLGHWKTTSLTFGEYYYLPLAIFRSYLLIAYGIELVLVLPLVLLLRVRARKNAGQGRMGTDRMSCDGRKRMFWKTEMTPAACARSLERRTA